MYTFLTNHQPKNNSRMPPSTIRVDKPGIPNAYRKGPVTFTVTLLLKPCDSGKVTRKFGETEPCIK